MHDRLSVPPRLRRGTASRVQVGVAAAVTAVLGISACAFAAADRTGAVPSGRHPAAYPRCFGAAARDPLHQPCENPKLRLSVIPTPRDAQIEPSAPCTPVERTVPEVCAFGVEPGRAVETVALLGDSHAVHWRAALQVIARSKRWRGLTLYRSSCPFTAATTDLPDPARTQCTHWAGAVVRWFRRHTEVRTVFVSQHSRAGVVVPRGEDPFAARVAGYLDAWKALPPSVQHIIVIRDPPYVATDTLACVRRAMAARKRAGLKCALPRSTALKRDPAAIAAEQLDSPRVQIVDLTPFMCDRSRCFPVVGGALVKKDMGHLTRVFATTLAPFLLREFNAVRAAWR